MKQLPIILILSVLALTQASFVFAAISPGIEGDICCPDQVSTPYPPEKGSCADGLLCRCEPSNCKLVEDPPGSGRIKVEPRSTLSTAPPTKPGICAPEDATVLCPITTHKTITELFNELTKWVLYIATMIVPIMIAIGAILFMASGGDPGRVQLAKRIIIWTIIGFVIILFGRGIYSIVTTILGGG